MSELEHFAGAVAPVVARLRDAIASGVRAETTSFLHEWELTDAAYVVLDALRPILPGGRASWTSIASALVYESPSIVMRGVDDLIERGLVETTGDGARLTDKGRVSVGQLRALTAKVADGLWGDHTSTCDILVPLLTTVAVAATETGGDTFGLLPTPYEPEDAARPLAVAELLLPLHFHRFDAHVSAWRSAGITAREATLLTGGALWRALLDDTNVRAAAPYSALKPRKRIDLISGLGTLPG